MRASTAEVCNEQVLSDDFSTHDESRKSLIPLGIGISPADTDEMPYFAHGPIVLQRRDIGAVHLGEYILNCWLDVLSKGLSLMGDTIFDLSQNMADRR